MGRTRGPAALWARAVPAAAALLSAAALAGCGPAVAKTLPADAIEQGIVDALEKAGRPAPDEVRCDESVKAEMAESTRCVLTMRGKRYNVAVVVTTVKDDGTAEYDIEIDEKPLS